ncbi:MAG: putative DNA binding domain-containing protein [Elusimicrobiota bacterium]|jgi:ATP-dependent DNA helicase RecG|nr:putative DNA binding domain-containing protein [Elusimicrobiota bacterium]
MNKQELLKKLSDIEWDDFEVKKTSSELPKNIWETVSAFSNTAGGWIILGVSQHGNKYEISGVDNAEKISQDFINTIRNSNKFNTKILSICKKYKLGGKTVLGFYIPVSENKPVFFNSLQNTFIRNASGDRRASEYEINALYRNQAFGTMSAKTARGTSLKSINKESYHNFRDYLKRMVPELKYNKLDDASFNQKLQIIKNGKLTYGGLLFIGKNAAIQNHFPDFRIDYLEIPGTSYENSEPRYTFRIQEQENIWEYYFILFQRLRNYADNPLRIGDMGAGIEDTKQLDALREALINMLIHCDYFSPMKPRIRVFTNRIEFENPGSLPRPIEEILKEDVSIPRNPVLAKLFRCAKLCENAGYGFDKMLVWEKETGNKISFKSAMDMTKVVFPLNIAMTEITQKSSQKSSQKIFEMIVKNNNITIQEISEITGLSPAGIKKNLNILKQSGRIRRIGPDKGGYWEIIK